MVELSYMATSKEAMPYSVEWPGILEQLRFLVQGAPVIRQLCVLPPPCLCVHCGPYDVKERKTHETHVLQQLKC